MQAGKKLRDWLREHKKTQVWLAGSLSCAQSMVSYYLNGGRPSYDRMRQIEDITDGHVALSDWPQHTQRLEGEQESSSGNELAA